MTGPAPTPNRLVSRLRGTLSPSGQQLVPFLQSPAPVATSSSVPAATQVQPSPPVQPAAPIPDVVPSQPPELVSAEDKLQLMDQIVTELEGQTTPAQPPAPPVVSPPPPPAVPVEPAAWPEPVAPVVPTVIQQATDTLNPSYPVSTAKEAIDRGVVDQVVQSEAGGVQHVEQEVAPEIGPEIEEYLQKVEDQVTEQPQEIVINPQGATDVQAVHTPQPVVVLPISPEVEKAGEHKPPSLSVRWLVEWSRRLMKMFTGRVIYRQT